MNKTCIKCNIGFNLDQDDLSFYEKMKVPVPEVCPDCRFKMRAMWRNETSLYTGQKCGICENSIISRHNPNRNYTIFCWRCFFSEKWDPKDYALAYDKSKSYIEQFKEFFLKTPKINIHASEVDGAVINSEYANSFGSAKNCYFIFNTDRAEDVFYTRGGKHLRDCSDLYFCHEDERCYECVNVNKSSGIIWGRNTSNSVDSMFVVNCTGVTNCFGCINLRNKSYCWFNEQLTRDEYIDRLKEVTGSSFRMKEMMNKFNDFCLLFPHRENNNLKVVNSSGDYLYNCKNIINSFEVFNAEDSKYVFSCKGPKNSFDIMGWGISSENLLNCVSVGFSSNVIGTFGSENCQNVYYSSFLKNCTECIACDGLKNSKYCIFNKQYTKEEYDDLKSIIFKELIDSNMHGLMIDPDLSFYSYNETLAQDFYPLTKQEALAQGFRWEDNIQMTKGKETLKPEEIPDHIDDINNDITKEILRCIDCERNYKITEQELFFYKKMKLPIPRRCFFCRHKNRIERRGPYKFWDRKCDKCSKDIKTNYAPDRPEIVYCEQCYQQEVY